MLVVAGDRREAGGEFAEMALMSLDRRSLVGAKSVFEERIEVDWRGCAVPPL